MGSKEYKEVKESKEHRGVIYNVTTNGMLLREQPYYRAGMSSAEAQKELEYLNKNMKDFYEGKYTPLWKQKWFS